MSAAAATPDPQPADCRCLCGNLLARWVAEGVELKCRRCKRTLLLPFPDDAGAANAGQPIRPIPLGEIA